MREINEEISSYFFIFLGLGKIPSFLLGPRTCKNSDLSSSIALGLGKGKITISPPL